MYRPNMAVSQSKILVLYTGGTIGMLNTERGLTVQPGFLSVSYRKAFVVRLYPTLTFITSQDWLRSQSSFNDPNAGTASRPTSHLVTTTSS